MDATADPSLPSWAPALQASLLFGGVIALYPAMAWLDRWAEQRRSQGRGGLPNLVGRDARRPLSPWLPLAFALKTLAQRDSLSVSADRRMHALAPFVGFLPPLGVLACLPWAVRGVSGYPAPPETAQSSVAMVLALLLVASVSPLLAAFGSANHLALLSALRLVQIRLCALGVLALGMCGVAICAQSGVLAEIVGYQGVERLGPLPALGAVVHPLGLATSLVALALWGQQSARSLPGAHPELLPAHAEESGGPTLLFHRFAEVMDFTALSACLATLFGGGFLDPLPPALIGGVAVGALLPFAGKTLLCGLSLAWLRRLLPRLRHDQALRVLWLLLPLSAVGLGLPLGLQRMLAG